MPRGQQPHTEAVAPLLQALHTLEESQQCLLQAFSFLEPSTVKSHPLWPTLGSQGLARLTVSLTPITPPSTALANPGYMTTARLYLESHPLLGGQRIIQLEHNTEDKQPEGQRHSTSCIS